MNKVGEGGAGVVYRAEDLTHGRTVALKFPLDNANGNDKAAECLVREACVAAMIQHPNICTAQGLCLEEGRAFLIMPFVDGVTLTRKLQAGLLEISEAIDIAVQSAAGLGEMHQRGIVHCDVKCENLMLTCSGEVRILDFGAAQFLGRPDLRKITGAPGSLAYMAPEQVLGDNVDPRTDIWALGVVLYEMLTGHLPFLSDHSQVIIYAILSEDPPPIGLLRGNVPPELEHVIARALAKDPRQRYALMTDMAAELVGCRGSQTPYV